jgi:hypothetical protein
MRPSGPSVRSEGAGVAGGSTQGARGTKGSVVSPESVNLGRLCRSE